MAKKTVLKPMQFSQFYYSILMGLSGLVIGTTAGWNSVSRRLLAATTPEGDLLQTAGIYCLGAAFGSMMHGQLARFLSYRLTVVLCDLFAVIGWLLCCSIDTKQQTLAVGHFVHGLASGGLGLIVPTYISHIINFELRGRMLMFHQMFIVFGVMFSYVFGFIATYPIMIGVCTAWPIFHMLITFNLAPESPYCMYKLRYGRDEIEKLMCQVKGQKYNVASDYNDMQQYMESANDKNNFGIKGPEHYMWIACIGLIAFQQLCGANTLVFHANEIFDKFIAAEVPSGIAQALTIIMLTAQLLLGVMAVELVELLGRKYMLIVSAVGMSLCLFTLALYHEFTVQGCDIKPDIKISVTLVIMYAEFYSVGWGTVAMTVYTEIMHFDGSYNQQDFDRCFFFSFFDDTSFRVVEMAFHRHPRGRTVPHADHRAHGFRRRRPGRKHVHTLCVRHRVRAERTVRVALRAGNRGVDPDPDPFDTPGPRVVRRRTRRDRSIRLKGAACGGYGVVWSL